MDAGQLPTEATVFHFHCKANHCSQRWKLLLCKEVQCVAKTKQPGRTPNKLPLHAPWSILVAIRSLLPPHQKPTVHPSYSPTQQRKGRHKWNLWSAIWPLLCFEISFYPCLCLHVIYLQPLYYLSKGCAAKYQKQAKSSLYIRQHAKSKGCPYRKKVQPNQLWTNTTQMQFGRWSTCLLAICQFYFAKLHRAGY